LKTHNPVFWIICMSFETPFLAQKLLWLSKNYKHHVLGLSDSENFDLSRFPT